MLRSFQYTEKSYLTYSIQNNLFQKKEIELARKFVENHSIKRNLSMQCLLCGAMQNKYFFTKWNVDYLYCENCKSIFAVCDEDTVDQYKANQDLINLKTSTEYQEQLTNGRKQVWKDFLEWLEVRTFRFMKKNSNLNILDIGNRFLGLTKMISESSLAGKYELRDSILKNDLIHIQNGDADIILYNDILKTECHLQEQLITMKNFLKKDGLLILGARVGSGFDILTLKEHNTQIYPYEHILLPSVNGLSKVLEKCGYEVLEIITPGVMDVKYVLQDIDKVSDREGFVQYLLSESNEGVLQEFQRFLQKNCLSSFVRIIARIRGEI